jgi:NADPH-dependent 2,4-dienoyl-CoA reductase/sulfur reductase-like enzyme
MRRSSMGCCHTPSTSWAKRTWRCSSSRGPYPAVVARRAGGGRLGGSTLFETDIAWWMQNYSLRMKEWKMQETNRHDLRHDAVVVGGGSAGLSAALGLGRSRRRTLVLDAGEPRNAPSSGVHGFFSRDGIPPKELLRIAREQLEPYPSVEVRSARATRASDEDGDFEVDLDDGSDVRTRKLLLATGVADELPEKPGFKELWAGASTTARSPSSPTRLPR